MVDIARPDLPVARRRRRLILIGAGLALLALLGYGVSRLPPAAPVVERGTVWIDTVARGPMVRDVRGTGSLVPEDLRWIPATAAGRVERIRLRPGAGVTPDTIVLELSNPELLQEVRDARSQLAAAEAQLANRRVDLDSALLTLQATVTALESDAREARLDAEAEAVLQAKGLRSACAPPSTRATTWPRAA